MIDFDEDIVDIAVSIEDEINNNERLRLLMVELYFMLPTDERIKFKREVA